MILVKIARFRKPHKAVGLISTWGRWMDGWMDESINQSIKERANDRENYWAEQ